MLTSPISLVNKNISDYQSIVSILAFSETYSPVDTQNDWVLLENTQPGFILSNGFLSPLIDTFENVNLPKSIALQSDGKIIYLATVMQGSGDKSFVLARYMNDGRADTSFGIGGKLIVNMTLRDDIASDVLIQPDGKILLLGHSQNSSFTDDISIVRYNSDGLLDTTFGVDGYVVSMIGELGLYAGSYSFAIQNDGKIVVATASFTDSYIYNTTIVRYLANGGVDVTFGENGAVVIPVGEADNTVYDIKIGDSGKIFLAGSASVADMDTNIICLNSDGTLDTQFGENSTGVVVYNMYVDDVARTLYLQEDGFLVGGSGTNAFILSRYLSNGILDGSFGRDGGFTTISFGEEIIRSFATSIIVQNDGKIILSGYISTGENRDDIILVRYSADGTPDDSFGTEGKLVLLEDFQGSKSFETVLQDDGKILLVGEVTSSLDRTKPIIIRINNDGSIDNSFGNFTELHTSVNFIEGQEPVLMAQNIIPYDAELALSGNYEGARLTLVRDGGASDEDLFSGINITPHSLSGSVIVEGVMIGAYTWTNGLLEIVFNQNSTQALTTTAFQSISYSNSSSTPPVQVQINWLFNDGNSGEQGDGGALSTVGTTMVSITNVVSPDETNNAPTFIVGTGFVDIKNELDGNVSSVGGMYGSIVGKFVEHDGRIIVIGTSALEESVYVMQYNKDGSLDTTFATGGKIFVAFDGYSSNRAKDIIVQDDGKIVVVAQAQDGRADFALVRLEQDGSIDQGYGQDGYVITNFGDDSFAYTALLQSDGKIVVAGQARGQSHLEFALARYTKDGKLDITFGDDGIQMDDIGGEYYNNIDDIAIDTDGKIYVLGYAYNAGLDEDVAIVARYTSTGWLDSSFSFPSGWTLGGGLKAGTKLIVTTDWVVITGYADTEDGNKLAIARFDKEDGSYDRNWVVETPLEDSIAHDMIFQADGKFIVVGSAQYQGFMIRYNFDSTVDTTFGNNGSVLIDENLFQVVVQNDGSILVMGLDDGALLLGHYDGNGKIDITFGATDTLIRPYVYNLAEAPIILNDHVEIFDKELNQQDNYQGATLTLQRHGGANSDDLFSGAGIIAGATYGNIQINAKQLGVYTYGSGTLEIVFDKAITRAEVDEVMQSIAYSNNNLASLPTIELDWIFGDGNNGTQGEGVGQVLGTMPLSLNHVPLSQDSNVTLVRDKSYVFNVNDFVFNDHDQNDSLSEVVIVSLPMQGTLFLQGYMVGVGEKISAFDIAAGKLIYIPITADDQNIFGSFSYKVGDGWSYSQAHTLTLNAMNNTPVVTMDGATRLDVWTSNNNYHVWNDVAITADGKVIALGNDINDFILGRYLGNDLLDASFGTDNSLGSGGMIKTDINGETDSTHALVIQSDGKIIAAGQSDNSFALVRYNADGTLDTSFGTDAKVITLFDGIDDCIHDIVLQTNGKIVVAGRMYDDTLKEYHITLARYNSDGSLDMTFSGDGKIVDDFFDLNEYANTLGIQSDGKIVVGGRNADGFTIVRYNSNGTLDTSFGANGITTTDMDSNGIKELAIDAQNNILAVGARGDDFAVVRYTSNGTLDTSFGTNGMVILDGYSDALWNSIGVQSDGKIIVVGNCYNSELYSSSSMIIVARYTIDGTLDTSFGTNGIVELDGTANSLTIHEDNIIIAGSYLVDGSGGFGNPYGTPDETRMLLSYLDKNGYKTSLNKLVDENTAIRLIDDSFVISDVELDAIGTYDGATLTIARSTGANSDDLFLGMGIVSGQPSGSVVVNNVTIGTYQYNNGLLKMIFNENSSKDNVSTFFGSLSYKNASDAPLSKIEIDWIFGDGNRGEQGIGGSKTVSGNTIFYISSINDAPKITSSLIGSVAENAAISTVIYDTNASDADLNPIITYTLSGTDASLLNIDKTTGKVTLKKSADYETKSSYTFDVIASDGSLNDNKTVTVSVRDRNDFPTSLNKTITINEDSNHKVTLSSFAFKDQDTGDMLRAIKITTLPTKGTLTLNGVAVVLDQEISASDISSGKLIFTPETNANGTAYVTFGFKVSDGTVYSSSAYTTTINITAVRDDMTINGTSGNDTLKGDVIDIGSYDTLNGLGGHDTLNGKTGNDKLIGGGGDDILNGGGGADIMLGGVGNDTYYVDNAGDKVYETATVVSTINMGGVDIVISSISYTLGDYVENLRLDISNSIKATGNSLNNTITGNSVNNIISGETGNDKLIGRGGSDTLIGGAGSDILNGGAGKDKLSGGAGKDLFVFNTILNTATNVDTIVDFNVADDTIRLENDIFKKLTVTGTLNSAYFKANASGVATDANDYIVYETYTGKLFYDADGNGSDVAVQITLIGTTTHTTLTATDFVVI
ncbi:MAG: cadherin domain-containing protein [Sulfurimonas sp.]|nr:cadherin domain-containing protein [Sulfurimonas sp.]